MTRRWPARATSVAVVLAAAIAATAAVGDGSVVAQQPVEVITITTSGGGGQATETLENKTGSPYDVALAADPSCDPGVTFSASGNPFTLPASGSAQITLACATGQPPGMQRCLVHARQPSGTALADFLAVCQYAGSSSLAPSASTVDLGSVPAGGSSPPTALALTNNGSATITRLYLQTTDLDGDFELAIPCEVDAPSCDAAIDPVAAGSATTIYVACTPQQAGSFTAQLRVATDTGQRLTAPVTLTCSGTAASGPALAVEPVAIAVHDGIDIQNGSASTVVHLANHGGSDLVISDVHTVDVDAGGSADWSYDARGACTGELPPACTLAPGDQLDLDVTFDPGAIGRRNASLAISYRDASDTVDRTRTIPLAGTGRGATLALASTQTAYDLGTVPVGRMSSVDVDLVNRGNLDTTAMLSLMPSGPPFALAPAGSVAVTPGSPAIVALSCAPAMAGSASTVLTAHSDDVFASPDPTLAASCEGSTQPLYADPASIALGELRTGGAAVHQTIQLASTGAPVALSGALQLESPNLDLAVGSASGSTTPASFELTVDPTTPGDLADRVIASDTDGHTLRIPISGRVVTASYDVPAQLDLGSFCVDQPTSSQSLSLLSTGTGTMRLSAVDLAGAPSPFALAATAPQDLPADLAAGQSAVIAVAPRRRVAKGTITDTITWTTDLSDQPTATTALAATFLDSGAAVAPPAIDFGENPVHVYLPNGRRVTIQNCSGMQLELAPPKLAPPFSIDSPAFPSALAPNESATFLVGFHPARPGTFTDTLAISSPQLTSGPLEVALTGRTPELGDSDAGTDTPPPSSGCSCGAAGGPAGGWPIALALLLVTRRRRRGSS